MGDKYYGIDQDDVNRLSGLIEEHTDMKASGNEYYNNNIDNLEEEYLELVRKIFTGFIKAWNDAAELSDEHRDFIGEILVRILPKQRW
tara:strand:- start:279 stop:542 length:264 start_codon:yes stop_codon:yes gene_type:complete